MEEQNVLKLRQKDSWIEFFPQYAESALIDSVIEMERNSEWIPGIAARDIRLEAIDGEPMFMEDAISQYHLDEIEDLAMDTAQNGTKLMIYTGREGASAGHAMELVRNTAVQGIERVAKISGSALGRMNRRLYSETMNNAFSVARGSALALIRYGKLSGLHSGADGGYMVMPISKLLDISADALTRRFGEAVLRKGTNSHGFTRAMWELPDAQSRLIDMYQKALKDHHSQYAVNFMPGVDFHSSDTAGSCASLDPVFFTGKNTSLRFVEGVHIKHLRRGNTREQEGIDLFAEEAQNIFAKFEDATKVIAELAGKKIYNPANCCVRLCNRFRIAPKYGQAALDEVERIAAGELFISAHDLYIAMSEVLAEAERQDASEGVMTNLEEALMKIVHADFTRDDVSGVVSWGNGSD